MWSHRLQLEAFCMEVRIRFYFPNLKFISDRTFRETLKFASQRVHAIHRQEIDHIISSFELTERQRQSIQDRLSHAIDHIPNYYIETIERGSLTIAMVLSASVYFLLQKTMGKTIEEAWTKTNFHRRLVQYLSTPLLVKTKSQKSSGGSDPTKETERWEYLDRAFRTAFLDSPAFGRFKVDKLIIKKTHRGDMEIDVDFNLAEDFQTIEGSLKPLTVEDYLGQGKQKPPRMVRKAGSKKSGKRASNGKKR